jgi:galactose oxidase-like protein/List-Bact-rpt repeat protein/Kelch motif protein
MTLVARAVMLVALVALSAAGAPPAWAQPEVVGQWIAGPTLPYFPVHTHLLPDGRVMLWPGDQGISGNDPRLWDPATGQVSLLAKPGYDVFCSGHAFMGDGKLFVAGGHVQNGVGLAASGRYDPVANSWTPGPNMNAGRWYPTVTTLSNGDMLVVSGSIDNTIGVNTLPQVFQSATGTWRDLSTARLAQDLYPQMLLAPNGRVFNPGPTASTRYLDTAGTGSWTAVGTRSGGHRDYGSAVMYADGKVLVMGGGDPPKATAEVIDLNAPSPAWRAVGSMQFARRQLNAVLLPDGRVLVTGGSSGAGFNNANAPVYPAEIWDPVTEAWTTLASATVPRLYHSAILLLPDGRLLSTGGNGYPQTELFSPPYLFKGARPTITSAPTRVSYGEAFFVGTPEAAAIVNVTWVRLSSVTHAFNANQRFNRLSFSAATGGLNVVAPVNPNLAPPGDYMLFVLNGQGVPSVAAVVRVGAAAPAPPAITQLDPSTATAGGPAFTLRVTGSGFVSGSAVRWNGAARTTTFVSATQLNAAISAGDIASAGTANVTVTNPPSGAVSNSVPFTIAAATSSFTLTVSKSGNGTVTSQPGGIACGSSCTATYSSGTVVTLTATPGKNQRFTGWSGACTGTVPTCSVTMNAHKNVGAAFKGGK